MDLDLIVPTYNRSQLLDRCLRSVAGARKPAGLRVTVVIADNNSTDNTSAVIRSFQNDTDLLIKYIFVERQGKSAALNEAISMTQAELIGLVDDDEELDPSWFEVAYREFSEHNETDYIGGPYLPNWEGSPPDWLPNTYRGAIGIVPRPERTAFSPNYHGMLMGGNAIIRRETLERVLPYPEELGKLGSKIRSGEDEVIYHRLLNIGAQGLVVPDLIIYHWIPAERLTKKYFRRWVVGRGLSVGMQIRSRGFEGPSFLGIPRFYFSKPVRSVMSSLLSRDPSGENSFTSQLLCLDCLATLCGRHLHR